jgi:NADH-quinone oxidoreductase subunit H
VDVAFVGNLTVLFAQQTTVELSTNTLIRWVIWLLPIFMLAFPLVVAYMVWGERKVAARFQDRIGPNRVGPLGLLQPIADLIKLLTKENIVPRKADQWVHLLAPVVILISAFLVMAVIPFGIGLAPVNLPAGMVYLVAVSGLSPLGVFLAGWSGRNKYSLLGAMRSVAQLVSYEVPQVLATIPVVLWAGSLSLNDILTKQITHQWFILSPPGLVSFTILLIASIAEVNRTPFDLPEAESEIIAGFHTEYSGMRFGLFFLAEYLSVFAVSCLIAVLFLGGGTMVPWSGFPAGVLGETDSTYLPPSTGLVGWSLINLALVAIFMVKVSGFIFVMFWIRATLPRMRVDRLMNFAWKSLVPVSIANVFIAAVWYEMYLRDGSPMFGSWWLNALVAWLVTGALELIVLGLVSWANRRSKGLAESPFALTAAARSA